MTNLSKFARLAWTLTRSKQAAAAGSGNNANNHLASNTNLNNTPQLMNHRSQNSLGKKARSSLNSPSMMTIGVNRFTEQLPQYRHEPPKTPPHILLHYSTFKVSRYLFCCRIMLELQTFLGWKSCHCFYFWASLKTGPRDPRVVWMGQRIQTF